MARKKRVWLGVAVSLLCLYLLFRALDPAALGTALRQVNPLYILPALAIYFGGVWLRAWRWRLLLRPALPAELRAQVRSGHLFRVLIIGFTVNNLLPARLGELARAYLLWRSNRVEPGATLATIVLERVLDGLTLCAFAGFTALLVPFPAQLQRAAWATAAVFLVAVLGLVVFFLWPAPFLGLARRLLRLLPPRFAQLGEHLLLTFVEGLAVLRQGRALAGVLALSVLAWLAEATMYLVIMFGFPFPARPAAALLGAAAANIGTMIPSSPGYVGTFDLPLQIVLTEVFGVALAPATSYTLVLHAALVVPVVLLGVFFLWRDWRDGDGREGAGSLVAALRDLRLAASGRPAPLRQRSRSD
ncbi:MAG TPA: lysylphosphatidylglycerol synthase transmembrane domain-containing protein [Chloroflexota bacterium]|nr:lysylphosphatidylglycerol synthase transmembrane domain-containing protein [Chloroflexota bacterium]